MVQHGAARSLSQGAHVVRACRMLHQGIHHQVPRWPHEQRPGMETEQVRLNAREVVSFEFSRLQPCGSSWSESKQAAQ